MKLTDFTTLTFDMMGTLMDYETGFVSWFRKHAAAERTHIADNQILEGLARAEEVLPLMYLAVTSEYSLPQDKALAGSFAASVEEWPPFPDSIESLRSAAEERKPQMNTDDRGAAPSETPHPRSSVFICGRKLLLKA